MMKPLEYGQVLKRLHPLILSAFDLEELRVALGVHLTWPLAQIAAGDTTYPSIVLAVIEHASRHGMLLELVEVLSRERDKLVELGTLLAELRESQFGTQDAPPIPDNSAAGENRPATAPGAGARRSAATAGFVSQIPGAPAGTAAPATAPTVFVASPTPDLRGKKDRKAVADALRQAGYRVLPETLYDSGDRDAYGAALDRDLSTALLFVQVLGESGTHWSNAPPFTAEGLQFARAKARGIPCLRWRPGNLDLAAIQELDAAHHRYLTDAVAVCDAPLLDDERVQAGLLEDFRVTAEQRMQ
ncbi:MAG: hypothetical protein EHM42_09670, partial [Planctomycetaceae bacterium]